MGRCFRLGGRDQLPSWNSRARFPSFTGRVPEHVDFSPAWTVTRQAGGLQDAFDIAVDEGKYTGALAGRALRRATAPVPGSR